jgi:hypothetical protein
MGGAPSPRIAQETLRRTPRICTRACRRVQVAQRLRSRASGANGLFCAYKAEVNESDGARPAQELPKRPAPHHSHVCGVVESSNTRGLFCHALTYRARVSTAQRSH